MRKHDVRKWLHAVLDLLPVILIPVFMVYSHRHDVTENVQVNYKYQSNEVNSTSDLVIGNIYDFNFQNTTIDNYFGSESELVVTLISVKEYNFNNYNDIQANFLKFYESTDFTNVTVTFNMSGYDGYITLYFNYDYDYFTDLYIGNISDESFTFHFIGQLNVISSLSDYNIISYTDYNVIESVDIENTNVMDSFMNNFNNTIDKHFNMGNVFNLGDVYQWFNTNIFGGNAPVIIQSIYNIVIYELVMDLLFLLYGLFMWFIDMIQKLMEKPLNSVK